MFSAKLEIALLLAVGLTAGVGVSQEVIDSVDVGCTWVGSLDYNSRANVLYGVSELGRVFTIDCATNRLLSWIGVRRPFAVCYNSLENKAYCTFWDSVLVISGDSHVRIGSIPVPMASNLVWDARTNRLYVSGYEEDVVGVIDCRTDSLLCLIPVPGGPLGLDLNTRHPKLYARCVDAQNVAVIDLTTNQVARVIPTGGNLLSSCYAGSVDKYYCDGDGGTTVIHGADDTVVAIIPWPVAMSPSAMLAVDAHSLVTVALDGARCSVQFVSGRGDSVFAVLPVGRDPLGLTWSPATDLAYCANAGSDNVSVLAGDGSRSIKTLPVSDAPSVLALASRCRLLYVGHYNSSKVYVIGDSMAGVGEQRWHAVVDSRLQAEPNPFSGAVMLRRGGLSTTGQEVAVFAHSGRRIAALRQASSPNDAVVYQWDGRDATGRKVPPGIYFARLAGSDVSIRLVKVR